MLAAMDTAFDRDTAVSPQGDGVYTARVASGWRAGVGPHGGYLAAIVLKALSDAVGDPDRAARSLTIHYASSPATGPVAIRATVEREGRSLSTLSARVEQDGKLVALALSAFSLPWQAPEAHELPMPQVALPDAERRSTPGLFDNAPEFTKHLVMQPRVGAPPFAGTGAPMKIGGWIGMPERRPIDAPALAVFCDAWFPPSFIALSEPAISPTVDLTIHFRQPISHAGVDPADLCLAIFDTRLLHDGFFEEDGVVWAADGTVLAQSRQLGIIMPTDKPVLQPASAQAGRASDD
jgi:acyl-CoA thioesterase